MASGSKDTLGKMSCDFMPSLVIYINPNLTPKPNATELQKTMTISISQKLNESELTKALKSVMNLSQNITENLRQTMLYYSKMVLWNDPNSVVAEVLLLDAWDWLKKNKIK
jgi:hypothetical protein